LDTLLAFRATVYVAFGRRVDARCERMDALAGAGAVAAPVHLSLEAVHRRGWGRCSAALNKGESSAEAIGALLAQHPLAAAAGEPLIYGVDTSVWPRCDADTSPERGCYHHSSRPANGQPIVAGGRARGRPTQPHQGQLDGAAERAARAARHRGQRGGWPDHGAAGAPAGRAATPPVRV
jgi:hypothetical protein